MHAEICCSIPMLVIFTMIAALTVAYANGANANFKGVASLFGSGTTGYWPCVLWATLATALGCMVELIGTSVMLQAFSGKNLVPIDLATQPLFLFAVSSGAGMANLFSTRLGFPVSTTHMLIGGLVGAGLATKPDALNYQTLWETFAKPLLLAPFVAILLGAILYRILKWLKVAPDHRSKTLDTLHYLSAGAVCFARGMNDTPKIAALLVGVATLSTRSAMLMIATLIAIGGLISAKHVANTLAHKITDMNPSQGFTANLATALLVIVGTMKGLPLSTTHVTVGALLGIGITTQQAKWKTIIPVLTVWLITLPSAAAISALIYKLGSLYA